MPLWSLVRDRSIYQRCLFVTIYEPGQWILERGEKGKGLREVGCLEEKNL